MMAMIRDQTMDEAKELAAHLTRIIIQYYEETQKEQQYDILDDMEYVIDKIESKIKERKRSLEITLRQKYSR